MSLLSTIVWWWGLIVAACGAGVVVGVAWFLFTDSLRDRVQPDRDDPLEQAFALPCAPDPRVR